MGVESEAGNLDLETGHHVCLIERKEGANGKEDFELSLSTEIYKICRVLRGKGSNKLTIFSIKWPPGTKKWLNF